MIDFEDQCPVCGAHHHVQCSVEEGFAWIMVCPSCKRMLELDWDYLEDRSLSWMERRVNYKLSAVREDRKTCL